MKVNKIWLFTLIFGLIALIPISQGIVKIKEDSSLINSFLGLDDTPGSYTGANNLCVVVNSAGNALGFVACNSTSGSFNVSFTDTQYWRLDGTNDNLVSSNWDMGIFNFSAETGFVNKLIMPNDGTIRNSASAIMTFTGAGITLEGTTSILNTLLNIGDGTDTSEIRFQTTSDDGVVRWTESKEELLLGTDTKNLQINTSSFDKEGYVFGNSSGHTTGGNNVTTNFITNFTQEVSALDTQKTTTPGDYLFNDSTTIFFNETKLNNTIDDRLSAGLHMNYTRTEDANKIVWSF